MLVNSNLDTKQLDANDKKTRQKVKNLFSSNMLMLNTSKKQIIKIISLKNSKNYRNMLGIKID